MNLQLTKIKSSLPQILGVVVFVALVAWFITDGIRKPQPPVQNTTLLDSIRVENTRAIEANEARFEALKDSIYAEHQRQYELLKGVMTTVKRGKNKDNEINSYTPIQRDSAYVACIARIRAKYRAGRFNR